MSVSMRTMQTKIAVLVRIAAGRTRTTGKTMRTTGKKRMKNLHSLPKKTAASKSLDICTTSDEKGTFLPQSDYINNHLFRRKWFCV